MQVRRSLGALEERPFRLLFLGQAATAFGNRMSWVALPFAVLAISDSATALGLVLACGMISMAASCSSAACSPTGCRGGT